jgi:hypothetical protein
MLGGWNVMLLRTPSVRVADIYRAYVILILGA